MNGVELVDLAEAATRSADLATRVPSNRSVSPESPVWISMIRIIDGMDLGWLAAWPGAGLW
jgi:hypothetical protein